MKSSMTGTLHTWIITIRDFIWPLNTNYKQMKNPFFYFLTLLIYTSCTEDVSKNINTDLTKEVDQFFQFSEAISESSYLANISYSDYFRITAEELPGCPTITRKIENRILELDYSNSQECDQPNKTPRKGKIILDFSLSNTPEMSWTLTYEAYSFGTTKIEGVRNFSNLSFGENIERIENLKIELEKNLRFTVSGSFSYSVARLSFRPFALSTRGRIEGTNPAGRDFSLVITQAKEQFFSCYRQGWELPQTGSETWLISRGNSSGLDYIVNFATTSGCDPTVISTLPDGRSLQLNP